MSDSVMSRIPALRVLPRRHATVLLGLLVLGCVLGWLTLAGAPPASAHADLEFSVPADGATLDAAPAAVRLTFSEAVAAEPDAVRVLHAAGWDVPGVRSSVNAAVVTAALPKGLTPDTYLVRWRVLSDEGHVLTGALSFAVAGPAPGGEHSITEFGSGSFPGIGTGATPTADAATPDPAGSESLPSWPRAVAESVSAVGVALLLGGLVLWLLTGAREPVLPGLRRQVLAGGAAVAAGAVVALLVLAAQVEGRWAGVVSRGAWQQVLGTSAGRGLALRAVAALTALVLVLAGRSLAALVPALGAALVVAVTFPLAGHPVTDPQPWLAVPVVTVHVVAASVWAGAVVALLPLLTPGRRDARRRGLPVVARLAAIGVTLLVLSGLVQAWRRVPSWSALVHTTYGQLLLVKAGLVLGLLAVAAVSLRGSSQGGWAPPVSGTSPVPRTAVGGAAGTATLVRAPAAPPTPAGPAALRRSVPAEVILLAGALVIAGLLATLRPPAPAATTTGAAPSARSATQPREQVLATADGGRVVLDLHPAAGSLGLDLRVLDAKGAPADVVAVVSAQPEGTVLPATALPLQRLATGRFVADPVPLTPPGRWRVSVDLTGEAGRTERATTSLSVP